MILDAHHHFWRYTAAEFGWINDDMARIRRDYLPEDLELELAKARVDGVVTVQARASLEETEWLLDLYREHGFIKGVVGWLPLAADDLSGHLERLTSGAGLVGAREVLQGMPDEAMEDAAFQRGVAALRGYGLVYDLLIVERQLPAAIRFVDRHPDLPIVLDHVAKPRVRDGALEPWATRLRELARRPNVCCKISGMVTEAKLTDWTPGELRPYFDVALEAFGPRRLLLGSDWPVCLAAGRQYGQWIDIAREWVASLSMDEQADVLGNNAARVYRLERS